MSIASPANSSCTTPGDTYILAEPGVAHAWFTNLETYFENLVLSVWGSDNEALAAMWTGQQGYNGIPNPPNEYDYFCFMTGCDWESSCHELYGEGGFPPVIPPAPSGFASGAESGLGLASDNLATGGALIVGGMVLFLCASKMQKAVKG